jgi:NitT/TauT family transport system substrate-binding protein
MNGMGAWMKKLFFCILGITLLTLLLTGCRKETSAANVRLIETVHSIFYAPQYVALEKGFFAEEGLNVTVDVAQGSDKATNAVITNNADIALTGTETGIYVYNEGKENYPVIFAQLTNRAGNFLVARQDDPDFQWANVKGKTIIGGRPGSMPEMLLEYILEKNGIIPHQDVEIVNNLQFTSTAGAFVSGIGDYTAEFEPSATALENQSVGSVVASLGVDSGTVPYTVYLCTKNYLETNPDMVQKFTNAVYRGEQWVKNHSYDEIAKAIQPQFKENNLEDLVKMIQRYDSTNAWKQDPILDEESFTLVQDILDQGGVLEKRAPYQEMVNVDFARKAIETIK